MPHITLNPFVASRLLSTPVAEAWTKTHYQNMLTGKFCIRQNITVELENELIDFSVKPKITIMFTCFLYFFWFTFFLLKGLIYR